MTLKLFTIFHKPFLSTTAGAIVPFQVGTHGQAATARLFPRTDSDGDNIAVHHPRICEYAAYYQVWKNEPPTDFIGFMQYRRYFNLDPKYAGASPIHIQPTEKNLAFLANSLNEEAISSLLGLYDVIVPTRMNLERPMTPQYELCHEKSDWSAYLGILKGLGFDDAEGYYARQYRTHLYNMFITRWSLFDAYMKDAMAVVMALLEALPEREDPYQKRAIAFCMERFWPYWVWRQRLRFHEAQIFLLDLDAK